MLGTGSDVCPTTTSEAIPNSSLPETMSDAYGSRHATVALQDQWQLLLLHLPPDLFVRHVVKLLSRTDKRNLRQVNRYCRTLVNAATHTCVLDAACSASTAAAEQVPGSFPCLRHISLVRAVKADDIRSSGNAAVVTCTLQRQLPGLLKNISGINGIASGSTSTGFNINAWLAFEAVVLLSSLQLPQLSSLSYNGPTNRRQPGLDLTPGLAALAAHMAAAEDGQHNIAPHIAQQQQHQLTQLELCAGCLPDSLMEVVGLLSSLRNLRLTATTATSTTPLAKLSMLTKLSLTVTPPLLGALTPLPSLKHLAVLHLVAISPAKGWGTALKLLQGGSLVELQLILADICDADIAAVAALTSLTHLDLHCSRHLTAACVQHLAELPNLSVLNLAHTGLQLGFNEMHLLGMGCRQLTELHAEFDLRCGTSLAVLLARTIDPRIRQLQDRISETSAMQDIYFGVSSSSSSSMSQPSTAAAAAAAHASSASMHAGNASAVPTVPVSRASLAERHRGLRQDLEDVASRLDDLKYMRASESNNLPSSSNYSWPPIRHLSISSGCSVANLSQLLLRCPELQRLELEGLGPSGNEIAAVLADHAKGLTALQISGCSSMGTAGCQTLASSLSTLQELSLTNVGILPDSLAVLLQGFSSNSSGKLTRLRIERCPGLTDHVINSGIAALSSLRQLELVACDGIQDEHALLGLVTNLLHLTEMTVTGCKGVSEGFDRRWEAAAAAALLAQPGCRDPVKFVTCQPTC